jgi:uncharacterized protein YcaQ
MRSRAHASQAEARWLAIGAQGLAQTRPTSPIGVRHLRSTIASIDVIQLDAINVVARAIVGRVGGDVSE